MRTTSRPAALAVLLAVSAAAVSAAPGPATCQAVVTLSNVWDSAQGDATFTSVNLNIINDSPALVPVPWTLTLKSPTYGVIRQVTFPLSGPLCLLMLLWSHHWPLMASV